MVPVRMRVVVAGSVLLILVVFALWVGLTTARMYGLHRVGLPQCIGPAESGNFLAWRLCMVQGVHDYMNAPDWLFMRFVALFLGAGLIGMAIGRWSRPVHIETAAFAGAVAAVMLYLLTGPSISLALAALAGAPAGAAAGAWARRMEYGEL